MKSVPLPTALFTLNRERLVKALLPRSVAVLNANDIMPTNADGSMAHLQNADLFYLTGIRQEETMLLLAPDAFDPNHREILFLRQPNEHLAIWEGHKLTKEQATPTCTGARVAFRTRVQIRTRPSVSGCASIEVNCTSAV